MEMQLTLFEECQLDDESGRCKALTEAIEALSSAVEVRRNAPKDKEFELILGPTAIQEAATKLRASAATFGPEQKEAANVWIKKLTSGEAASGAGLLEEQITSSTPGQQRACCSPARRTPARAAVSRVGSLASACSARAPSPLPSTASGSSRAALEALLMASGGAAHGLLRCRGRLDALQLPAVGGGALRAAGGHRFVPVRRRVRAKGGGGGGGGQGAPLRTTWPERQRTVSP